MQKRERVVLDHLGILILHRLHYFVDPSLHDVRACTHELHACDQSSAGYKRLLVHNGLLQVPLDVHEHGRVGDSAEHADRVCAIEVVCRVHVLGQRGRDDDDAVSVRLQLLDDEVHEPAELLVLVAEQELGHREEDALSRLPRAEVLALAQEVEELGHDLDALGALDVGVIEGSRLLYHVGLVHPPEHASPARLSILLILVLLIHGWRSQYTGSEALGVAIS
mmetsp:Transcript_28476/g.55535  ORF Transcript_28476/g.55535 Transcript_28476/m.55535 type:complete len:222 (-) Transcript_28476:45-710(-)